MATAVIYKSSYGATKQYAQHIAQELGADLYDFSRIKKFNFEKYDTLVFGGGIYAGRLNGLKQIVSVADKLNGKNLVIFSVGIGDPTVASNVQTILKGVNKALPKELMSRTHIFSLRGSLDCSKLSFMHRTIMKMVLGTLSKKTEEEKTADDRAMLESLSGKVDYVKPETAMQLIEFVKSLT